MRQRPNSAAVPGGSAGALRGGFLGSRLPLASRWGWPSGCVASINCSSSGLLPLPAPAPSGGLRLLVASALGARAPAAHLAD